MKYMVTVFTVVLLATFGVLSPASADSVRIGVNIGVPAPVFVAPVPRPVFVAPVPRPVVVAPAPVLVAPPAPVVFAPGAGIYYYGAQYYTFYNGAWFVGPRYGGPWTHVVVGRVPRPIFAAPHFHGRSFHGGPPPGHVHGRW